MAYHRIAFFLHITSPEIPRASITEREPFIAIAEHIANPTHIASFLQNPLLAA